MSPYLKLLLFITGIVVIINIVVVIKKMIPLIKRLNEIKRLKRNFNVISVEGEIIQITPEKLNRYDTKYILKLYYEVGWKKVYKDFVVINKQSVRVGQKVNLLCDDLDPENAMLESDCEVFGLKNLVINIIFSIVYFIFDAALQCAEYIFD